MAVVLLATSVALMSSPAAAADHTFDWWSWDQTCGNRQVFEWSDVEHVATPTHPNFEAVEGVTLRYRWGTYHHEPLASGGIDWGDGTTSGPVSPTSCPEGPLQILAVGDSHTYDEPGQYWVDGCWFSAQPSGPYRNTNGCWSPMFGGFRLDVLPDRDGDGVADRDDRCPDAPAIGTDADGDGCTDDSACPQPTIPEPTRLSAGGGNWTSDFRSAGDDGLVAEDVRLGGRRMAMSMSLPYIEILTSLGRQRIELRPNGSTGNARSRLVDYEFDTTSGIDVRARWAIDWPARPSSSCLLVTQRYRFAPPRTKAQWAELPGGRSERGWCNPTQSIGVPPVDQAYRCARFYPTVSYEFLPGNGDTLRWFEAPQRLHLRPGRGAQSDGGATSSGLFADCDSAQTVPSRLATFLAMLECFKVSRPHHPVIRHSLNAVEEEYTTRVVRAARTPGVYDNYHCQLGDRVLAPGLDASWNPGAWGCPTCVHIHWRWGTGANFAPGRPRALYTSGRPMVSSDAQTVDISITRPGAATVDPIAAGWRSLASDQARVKATDQLFWYVGRSSASRDTFFKHGGFFADL